jgi:hypothetical protein
MMICSSIIHAASDTLIQVKYLGFECQDGVLFLDFNLLNYSANEVYFLKSQFEYLEHYIVDTNNNKPIFYKSIQVTAQDSNIILVEPNQKIQVRVEAKFLKFYSLKIGSEYLIDLDYSDVIISKKRLKNGYVQHVKIGQIKIEFCE